MTLPANLKKRTIVSLILTASMIGMLVGDDHFSPFAPFLLVSILLLQCLATVEITSILTSAKPRQWLVLILLLLNTLVFWLLLTFPEPVFIQNRIDLSRIATILAIGTVIVIFGIEVLLYNASGSNTSRVAITLLLFFYLGMPSISLLLIRAFSELPAKALAATIFVPKFGDVAAYLIGSLIGRHKMTPRLSPKKTWEGFAGGLMTSILTAIAIDTIGSGSPFKNSILHAGLFGLVVGLAGVFGDLFASMIKRDAQVKDASQTIPGFGGVLDVVDSILFAAPAAYIFFAYAQ